MEGELLGETRNGRVGPRLSIGLRSKLAHSKHPPDRYPFTRILEQARVHISTHPVGKRLKIS